MPELTIWDRLAMIDPMLTEQQRCLHEWSSPAPNDHRCVKCGLWQYTTPLPVVGRGDSKIHYLFLDALLRLAADLGLTAQITHFARGGTGRSLVKAWPRGKQDAAARVRDTLPAVALAHAIVKAYPSPVGEIPVEVPADDH